MTEARGRREEEGDGRTGGGEEGLRLGKRGEVGVEAKGRREVEGDVTVEAVDRLRDGRKEVWGEVGLLSEEAAAAAMTVCGCLSRLNRFNMLASEGAITQHSQGEGVE